MKKILKGFGYPEVVWLPKGERTFLAFICIIVYPSILYTIIAAKYKYCLFLLSIELVCIYIINLNPESKLYKFLQDKYFDLKS